MSERVAPMYCPYCGEEDLFPHAGVPHDDRATAARERVTGGWECRSCVRVFSIKFLGLAASIQEVNR